ncbi:matrixin family metalloprotease [Bacillus thuringiensis]|nr:matrixin family metalloprotease [Bacillus thuringiensis]
MTTNQPLNHCVQMNLPDDQIIEAARLAIQENPDNAPDTDEVSADSIDSFEMALVIGKKWRNGRTLRVRFLDGDPAVHEKVKRYANEWSRYANLKFAFGNDPDAEIRVSFQHPQGGYWSYVGTDNLLPNIPRNEATMNLQGFNSNTSETELSRVVLHEFGHCIGVSHEQSNPAANIPWDKEAVYRYYSERYHWSKEMVDRNVLAKLDPRVTAHTPHDPKSIMQYPVPNALTIGDYEIGWNTTLSEVDKRFIGQMYPF